MKKVIWSFWTGENPMSETRSECLKKMESTLGVPVKLVTVDNLPDYIVPGFEIPSAYWDLSETHRADFLRFYFMYHYGGGYADIKNYTKSWDSYFKRFEENEKLEIIGTRETQRDSVFEFSLQPRYFDLLSFGWFIMRDHCLLAEMMYRNAWDVLDKFEDKLKDNPAKCPRDKTGFIYPDGSVSKYPLRWGKIGGSIFHPAIAMRLDMLKPDERLEVVNYDLPPWDFGKYL